ncbi:conserved hypothetical protein [Xenorhabdus cabanillasii JM26]|uniref:Uncharacterized protein n=1 Tax=Xenorhabdus cabanillasii JM26 TaxID=1427517 RepID=W1JA42_9GAMM|nr:conserved hypothetical protein [Xenorhabdus cabanillasii JM26]
MPAVLHHIDSWEGITTKSETVLINFFDGMDRLGFYSSQHFYLS